MKAWQETLIPDKKDVIIALAWSLSQPVFILFHNILGIGFTTKRTIESIVWFPYGISEAFVTKKLYPGVHGDALMMFGVHIIIIGFVLTVYIVHVARLAWSFKGEKK